MNKYKARKTALDGHTFDSRAEAAMYAELKLLLTAGLIRDLVLQPKYVLQNKFTNAQGKKVREVTYTADFGFFDIKQNRWRIIDCKGFKTDAYKLKKKLLDFLLLDQGLYLEEDI